MPQRALYHLCLSQTRVFIVTNPQALDIAFSPTQSVPPEETVRPLEHKVGSLIRC
jgi:hypothetical protein